MTIELCGEQPGVTVHLDPAECALLVRLAADAERVNRTGLESGTVYTEAGNSYLSLSLALGRKIQELARQQAAALNASREQRSLAQTMIDLVLGSDASSP